MLSEAASSAARNLLLGGLLALALIMAGGVAVSWVRRRFHPSGRRQDGSLVGGLSIDRLEAMRRAGEISQEEFRVLRRAALGLDRGSAKTENSASSAPAGGDDDVGVARTDDSCAE